MTVTLVKVVKYCLSKHFGVNCSDEEIINLESSTDKKFSKHLIFDIKSMCFKDNYYVGNFVRMISFEIEKFIATGDSDMDVDKSEVVLMYVKDKDGNSKLFVDMGVYSRNRNFRILHATKYGKDTPLVLADDNISNYNDATELFLHSLVSYFGDKPKEVIFGSERNVDGETTTVAMKGDNVHQDGSKSNSASPYEELDSYIKSVVKNGYIKHWKYFEKTQTIVYYIENYRYCHNIQREHKSNGIMLVVNIKRGIWYQKCLDPDCTGFRSEEQSLPDGSLPCDSWPTIENEDEKPETNQKVDELWYEQDEWIYDVEC